MADDRIDEILHRLEALEQVVRELDERGAHPHRHHHHHHGRCRCHDEHDCGCGGHRHRHDRHDCGCGRDHGRRDRDRDGGEFDERRVVDLIVGLVAEHVEAIVARQIDRLLVSAGPADETPPADNS